MKSRNIRSNCEAFLCVRGYDRKNNVSDVSIKLIIVKLLRELYS